MKKNKRLRTRSYPRTDKAEDIYFIYDETLRENIWIMYGASQDKYFEAIKFQFGFEITDSIDGLGGRYSGYDNKDGNIVHFLWTRHKDPAILAHEAFHAVTAILGSKGVWLTDSSEESYGYLLERIIHDTLEIDKLKKEKSVGGN